MFICEQISRGWDLRQDFIMASFDESERVMGKNDTDIACLWMGH